MKNILFMLFLFSTGLVSGQHSEFKITNEGYSKYVVEEIKGILKEQIYSKVLDWALITYKNPDRVITVKKENEYIRINAVNVGDNYVIEVAVKDEKYKFTLISYEAHSSGITVSLMDVPNMLNSKGEVKWIYGGHKNNIAYLNDLNLKLKDYIINGESVSKKDW
jgi:hypothetical protein